MPSFKDGVSALFAHFRGDVDCQNLTVRGRIRGLPQMRVVSRAWLSVAPGIPNTTDTLVRYDKSDDPLGLYNPGTGLFTVPYKGYYCAAVQHRVSGGAGGVVAAGIYVNAVGGFPSFLAFGVPYGGNGSGADHVRLLNLNAGDTVAANIWHSSGTGVTMDPTAGASKMDLWLVCAL